MSFSSASKLTAGCVWLVALWVGTGCSGRKRDFAEGSGGAAGDASGGASGQGGGGGGAAGHDGATGGAGASQAGSGGQPDTIGQPCSGENSCDDGRACNGVERCVEGSCEAGAAVDCAGGFVCVEQMQGTTCVASDESRWLVFAPDTSPVTRLYAVDVQRGDFADPVELVRDLPDGESVAEFRWSPDGRYLSYATSLNGEFGAGLYLVDMSGVRPGTPVRLGQDRIEGVFGGYSWSPRSDALLLHEAPRPAYGYLIPIDDGVPQPSIRVANEGHLANIETWSPTGRYVVYPNRTDGVDHFVERASVGQVPAVAVGRSSYNSPDDLWVAYDSGAPDFQMVLAPLPPGGAATAVGPWGSFVSWSPDGRSFAYIEGSLSVGELWIGGVDGAAPSARDTGFRVRGSGCWAPSSSHLSFVIAPEVVAEYSETVVYDPSTSYAETIASVRQHDPACWSPKGRYLYVKEAAEELPTQLTLLRRERAGGNHTARFTPQALVGGGTLDGFGFAPSDRALVFWIAKPGTVELYHVDLSRDFDATVATPVQFGPHDVSQASWSAGSGFVAAQSGSDGYVFDARGPRPEQLARLPFPLSSFSWQP